MKSPQKRQIIIAGNNGEITKIDLNNLFNGDDFCDAEKQAVRKIIRDIFVNDLTYHQGKIAAMYFCDNMRTIEIANILGTSISTVQHILQNVKIKIAENIGSYRAEGIQIIDCSENAPVIVRAVTRVYKIKNEPAEKKKTKEIYNEIHNEYEETIAFIESRIKQLDRQIKTSVNYLEQKTIYQRKLVLEQELEELHHAAHKVNQYI